MRDDGSPLNVFSKSVSKESPVKHMSAATVKIEPTMTSSDLNFSEVRGMVSKIKDIKSEIEDAMNKVVDKSGFTKEQIWTFLENQSNFSPEQWTKFQNDYQELADKVWSSISITQLDLEVNTNSTSASQKGRRGRQSGARKNWMFTG